jgi:tripartite-type tricarboxylate transporter receptor subunit TctC
MYDRRIVVRGLGATLGVGALIGTGIIAARAADWPTRPVRIIAPSTPGGAADTFGRLLGEHLSEAFGQPFVVENRPGAGGLIGGQATARSEPDGYTFMASSIAYIVLAPAVSTNPGFDVMRDLTHIAHIGGSPSVLVVHPSLKVRTMGELLALIKNNEPMPYGSPGVGTLGHIVGERFAELAGVRLQHIPHKGSSQAMMDLIAGTLKVGTMSWGSALMQVRAGNMIPIAVTSAARLSDAPDLPTFKELGYDVVATTWYGLSGPAGLPSDIVQRVNRSVAEMLKKPQVRERLKSDGVETEVMTEQQFTAFVASESAKWGPLAKRIGQGS